MKRLVSVCLLILCLAFPVLAGHTLAGGRWCDCNDPASHYQGLVLEDEETPQRQTLEIMTVLEAFAIWFSVRD